MKLIALIVLAGILWYVFPPDRDLGSHLEYVSSSLIAKIKGDHSAVSGKVGADETTPMMPETPILPVQEIEERLVVETVAEDEEQADIEEEEVASSQVGDPGAETLAKVMVRMKWKIETWRAEVKQEVTL